MLQKCEAWTGCFRLARWCQTIHCVVWGQIDAGSGYILSKVLQPQCWVEQGFFFFSFCLFFVHFFLLEKSLPTWLSPEQRAKLLRDEKFSEQLILLQDFEMPEASHRMKISRDERFLFVNGVYKPSCKIFEVSELSMKCERFFDEETIDFEILTDDYAKVCYMGAMGSLFFHAKYGQYYTTRLPMIGRCIKYDRATCDLYAVGSSSQIQRLNLEAGRFSNSIATEFDAINTVTINPVHSLLAFGGDDGVFECRDPRCPSEDPISRIHVGEYLYGQGEINADQRGCDVSALEFHPNGIHFGVGTGTGHALLYDLRSPNPMFVKDHRNELPIHSIRYGFLF